MRNGLLVLLGVAAGLLFAAQPAAARDYNCSDFSSWRQAQRFFLHHHPKADPYNLDADDDGIACESLRSAMTVAQGMAAINHFAKLETKHFPGSRYELGSCRRQRSSWTSEVVVWCPIAWHFAQPISDSAGFVYEDEYTRIFAFRAPRGCVFVKEPLSGIHRCLG